MEITKTTFNAETGEESVVIENIEMPGFSEKELLQKELFELETWFKEYDNQVKQYNRCQRLKVEFDKDINELDNQAKINQERIAELRQLEGKEPRKYN